MSSVNGRTAESYPYPDVGYVSRYWLGGSRSGLASIHCLEKRSYWKLLSNGELATSRVPRLMRGHSTWSHRLNAYYNRPDSRCRGCFWLDRNCCIQASSSLNLTASRSNYMWWDDAHRSLAECSAIRNPMMQHTAHIAFQSCEARRA